MQKSTQLWLLVLLAAALFLPGRAQAQAVPTQHRIDTALYAHAQRAPLAIRRNILQLVEYLIAPAVTEYQKASVLAYWMVQNIKYNKKDFFLDMVKPPSVRRTLGTRTGVCGDYAVVYQVLCQEAGIQAFQVFGLARANLLMDDRRPSRFPNHAWNVVVVDSQYYLMDITWATPSVGRKWVDLAPERIRTEWLFADPYEFIRGHLPSQQRWQLLEHPLTSPFQFRYMNYLARRQHANEVPYAYADSIAAYLALPAHARTIVDVEEQTDLFFTNRDALNYLADQYKREAGKLVRQGFEVENYYAAIAYYAKARKIYQRPRILGRNRRKYCERRIKVLRRKLYQEEKIRFEGAEPVNSRSE